MVKNYPITPYLQVRNGEWIRYHLSVSLSGCMDTSDLRQFGIVSLVPKCLTFFCRCQSIFGTLRHQFRSVSTFYEGAEVSNRHFGRTLALVPKCLGHIGGAFMFLYRFTTSRHICTIHRDLPTASQDILYI